MYVGSSFSILLNLTYIFKIESIGFPNGLLEVNDFVKTRSKRRYEIDVENGIPRKTAIRRLTQYKIMENQHLLCDLLFEFGYLFESQFSSGTTQPTYGLFFDAVAGANCKFGKRDNNSTVGIGSVFSMTMSAEHTVKFVKTGNLIEFYLDDSLKTSSTESWIDNYSDYCFSMIRWSTSGTSKIKNVKIKPL